MLSLVIFIISLLWSPMKRKDWFLRKEKGEREKERKKERKREHVFHTGKFHDIELV